MKLGNENSLVRVRICKRRTNDHRSYKILMNLVGNSHEFAIEPETLMQAASQLMQRLQCDNKPDYIVGLAAAGIPITIAVSYATSIPAIIAYKFRLFLPNEISWREPHCIDSEFYLYGLEKGKSVILIDDEVDSGNTLKNAIIALRAHGIEVIDVGCILEVVHHDEISGRGRISNFGLSLKSLYRIEM